MRWAGDPHPGPGSQENWVEGRFSRQFVATGRTLFRHFETILQTGLAENVTTFRGNQPLLLRHHLFHHREKAHVTHG